MQFDFSFFLTEIVIYIMIASIRFFLQIFNFIHKFKLTKFQSFQCDGRLLLITRDGYFLIIYTCISIHIYTYFLCIHKHRKRSVAAFKKQRHTIGVAAIKHYDKKKRLLIFQ